MAGGVRGGGGRGTKTYQAELREIRVIVDNMLLQLERLEQKTKLENLLHLLERLERRRRARALMEIPEGRHKPLDSPEGVSKVYQHEDTIVDENIFHRPVIREATPFSLCESEDELLVVREETTFSLYESEEDKVVVDWDLPPVYDTYPEDEDLVFLTSDCDDPFVGKDTSIVSISAVYKNQALYMVENLNARSAFYKYNEEFILKGTCGENCTGKFRGRIFSNKGRSIMVEELPNIVSTPVLCYDNFIQETQVSCMTEIITTSSDLYKRKFCRKKTCVGNYASRIRGRILLNSRRNAMAEDLVEKFRNNITAYHDSGAYVKDTLVQWPATTGRRWTTESECLTTAIAALELLLPSDGDGLSHGDSSAIAKLAHKGLCFLGSFHEVVYVVARSSHSNVQGSIQGVRSHSRDTTYVH